MKKNSVLKFTTFILSISRVLISLFFAILIIFGIASFINQDFAPGTILKTGNLIFDSPANIELGMSEYAASKPIQFSFVLLQNMLLLVLIFQILGSILKVTRSINNPKTFAEENVKAFQKISLYSFLIFCVEIIRVSPDKISFGIHFEPLVASAFAFLLAEVFKEGHQLMKENELTV